MSVPRNNTIDIARGAGIILVVLGHNWIITHNHGELYRIIFSFHMPLFFFLSGVVFKSNSSFGSFFISRADALIKPYFVVLSVWGLARIAIAAATWQPYFSGVLYATGNTIEWVPLWYLPHLFICLLAVFAICKLLKQLPQQQRFIATCLLAILLLSLGNFCLMWAQNLQSLDWQDVNFLFNDHQSGFPGLPWSLDLLGISSAFILLGVACQSAVAKFHFQQYWFALVLGIFVSLHWFFDETMDLHLRHYGHFWISTAQALSGIYLLLSLAFVLQKWPDIARILAYIGQGSLFILIFHSWTEWKIFSLMAKVSASDDLNAIPALLGGVLLPLGLLALVKRRPLFSALLLPRQR
ncbi:acyltransferase family protein [Undibacterium sp. WLHG33]|uniref:acyltransferase family protein n=1 Tax=Undibacterium sp. WLHG33 TaxID=3412482 RepID=UPI003C2CDA3A